MKHILIIEDNKDVRENTAELLELSGYKVSKSAHGADGVKRAKTEKPDLIICDIMMPEMDGYAVLEDLSNNPETAAIPFIFLTAKTERTDIRKGMTLGADDYITKPFDETDIVEAIEARLKRSELFKTDFQRSADGIESFIAQAKTLEDLNKISKNRTMHQFKKKEHIYHAGNFPRGIYFIQQGKVKAFKSNEDGKDIIVGLYSAGDFFGYLSLMEDRPYQESAETMEESQIYFIPNEDFHELIAKNRDVANRFIKMLSNNILEMEDRMLKLAYNSVRKRVAEGLLTLEKTYNKEKKEPFTIAVNREDLANLVGTSTETVIRTLSDFKDEKLIDIKARLITILNIEKLQKMKN
jgi:CRP-like cAMP-binding protein/FixJ family two-component response regulator